MDVMTLRRGIIANMPHLENAFGKLITFATDVPAQLTECFVILPINQSGTGEPSPSNIRPISGYDGVIINVSPDLSNGKQYPVSWQSSVGTIWGGTVDVIKGTLTQTHAYALYTGASSESWKVENNNNFYIMTPSTWLRKTDSTTMFCNLAQSYIGVSQGHCMITSTGNFNIHIGGIIDIHTVDRFKAYLTDHPLQVVCQLQTPITYQLTPQNIKSLYGRNYIDAGNIAELSIQYWTHAET